VKNQPHSPTQHNFSLLSILGRQDLLPVRIGRHKQDSNGLIFGARARTPYIIPHITDLQNNRSNLETPHHSPFTSHPPPAQPLLEPYKVDQPAIRITQKAHTDQLTSCLRLCPHPTGTRLSPSAACSSSAHSQYLDSARTNSTPAPSQPSVQAAKQPTNQAASTSKAHRCSSTQP
jgi:hypothetical protein